MWSFWAGRHSTAAGSGTSVDMAEAVGAVPACRAATDPKPSASRPGIGEPPMVEPPRAAMPSTWVGSSCCG
eukprot:8624607-Alexandrium_andersonii.AAC.1